MDVAFCVAALQEALARHGTLGIFKLLTYHNAERPHATHDILNPDEAYASKTEPVRLAA
jgi:hypothetical protein